MTLRNLPVQRPSEGLDGKTVEQVLIGGDLSALSPAQRVAYYQRVCESLGLNPLTRPFDYIRLQRGLTLYAKKDATDQLRSRNNISVDKPEIEFHEDWIVVTVTVRTESGRTDGDIGVVHTKDMQGNWGNALMKAITKAKRRATLSICGLGWLDETEVDSIPDAKTIQVESDGRIVEQDDYSQPVPSPDEEEILRAAFPEPGSFEPNEERAVPTRKSSGPVISEAQAKRLYGIARGAKWEDADIKAYLHDRWSFDSTRAVTRDVYDEICNRMRSGVAGSGWRKQP